LVGEFRDGEPLKVKEYDKNGKIIGNKKSGVEVN